MDRDRALAGSGAPPEFLERMRLVDVRHRDLHGASRSGQLVMHADLADETVQLFERMYDLGLPIQHVTPVVAYGWDDNASMAANNTSGFNYRPIEGTTRMSMHGFGAAIDINPLFNPFGDDPATWLPPGSVYDITRPGALADSPACPVGREVVRLFEAAGWTWLGRREVVRDRHHFQKTGFEDAGLRAVLQG